MPATTIHRILYTPVYDPEYEKIAEWLAGSGERPVIEGLTDAALDRAAAFYASRTSRSPARWRRRGCAASDFITGWKRREEPLDIGFVDEGLDAGRAGSSRTCSEIFPTLVLFGDPAQLAPVGQSGAMVFDTLPEERKLKLNRIHRQAADNPILDLAHALADPDARFRGVRADGRGGGARRRPRGGGGRGSRRDLMARSPVLVWRNATRIRLIHAFRAAYGAPADALLPGEPLICDGIELPLKHRKKRIDLEARGLIKGAQVIYLGPGKRRASRACT